MTKKILTYDELSKLKTFDERFKYLKLDSYVGKETFGVERYLNQDFYHNDPEWRRIRREVIIRDRSCDLGIEGREIERYVIIHHMNPITIEDILNRSDYLLNPNFLICTTRRTHDAIHFGDETLLLLEPADRKPFDTCPWR